MHPRPCAASLGRDQGPAAHPKKVSLLRDAVLLCVHVLGFIPGLYDIDINYRLFRMHPRPVRHFTSSVHLRHPMNFTTATFDQAHRERDTDLAP